LVAEAAKHRAGDCLASWLLNTSHHHAKVARKEKRTPPEDAPKKKNYEGYEGRVSCMNSMNGMQIRKLA